MPPLSKQRHRAAREVGARALGHVADALVPRELEGFYREFDAAFDRLDVLVNVVGGVRQRRFDDFVTRTTAGRHPSRLGTRWIGSRPHSPASAPVGGVAAS